MVTIEKAGKGHVIKFEVAGNAGHYTATLNALTTALENAENPEERKAIGALLKAMMPNENQLIFTTCQTQNK